MLRVLQTQTLANKVFKLLETIAPTASLQALPAHSDVKHPTNDFSLLGGAPLASARRRRLRRTRLASSAGSMRASWF